VYQAVSPQANTTFGQLGLESALHAAAGLAYCCITAWSRDDAGLVIAPHATNDMEVVPKGARFKEYACTPQLA